MFAFGSWPEFAEPCPKIRLRHVSLMAAASDASGI